MKGSNRASQRTTLAKVELHMRAFAFITRTRCTQWQPVAQRFRCSRSTAYRYINVARHVNSESVCQ